MQALAALPRAMRPGNSRASGQQDASCSIRAHGSTISRRQARSRIGWAPILTGAAGHRDATQRQAVVPAGSPRLRLSLSARAFDLMRLDVVRKPIEVGGTLFHEPQYGLTDGVPLVLRLGLAPSVPSLKVRGYAAGLQGFRASRDVVH
jgi:hypothetical protein